ncbi:hypothetical protein GDO81_020881 [Engystomops pustulosus]|uniref:Uncharacterized protein n=1 Tax=Engystomops pustulosus TaxID=76066 RepID=A0AAV6ZJF8_ENGPU|nr:hypothetical protein GDO81_020881 [Engystomops pustulosus]
MGAVPEWVLISLIAALVALLLLTLFGLAVYSGLMTEVEVRAGPPPIRAVVLAYKFRVGPYDESGNLYTESVSLAPKLVSIGVYYDNPMKERKLCAHPYVEIYKGDKIIFMCPLSRQDDFYVPEMKELLRKGEGGTSTARV